MSVAEEKGRLDLSIITGSRDDNMEIEINEGYFYDPESAREDRLFTTI